MRVLHVGFGFSPYIVNGLVLYAEALMSGQVEDGDQVGYFLGGRRLPLLRRPVLHRWRRAGVEMFEWMNAGVVVGRHRGTARPDADLHDPPTEAAFRRVLDEFRPDVVHVHDLGGLASSLPAVASARGVPVAMTLHDYHALCPTVKLFDVDGQNCLRTSPGPQCVRCCARAPRDHAEDEARTGRYLRMRVRSAVPGVDRLLRRPRVLRASDAVLLALRRPSVAPTDVPSAAPVATASAYDRRRDVNLERLGACDALLTYSARSSQIHDLLGVPRDVLRPIRINPAHVAALTPRRRPPGGGRVRFAVLNAGNSREKGGELLVGAVEELARRGLGDRYRLAVHGWIAPDVEAGLRAVPAVDLMGPYRAAELDALLEPADVGIVPSIWEEVLGFVGLEFLAKGIPVVGNAIGGIPEYVREDETGWLNHELTGPGLADAMIRAMEDPVGRAQRAAGALAARDELVRPIAVQVREHREIYADLLRRRAQASGGIARKSPRHPFTA